MTDVVSLEFSLHSSPLGGGTVATLVANRQNMKAPATVSEQQEHIIGLSCLLQSHNYNLQVNRNIPILFWKPQMNPECATLPATLETEQWCEESW